MRPLWLPTGAGSFLLRATCLLLASTIPATLLAGTFGTVVPVRGLASDVALDELRGSLYIANYTANRIEVLSTSTGQLGTSIPVPAQPSSLALSRDGGYLVVTHASAFPGSTSNAITILNLTTNQRRTIATTAPALSVAFGGDGRALAVTTKEFLWIDPAAGSVTAIDSVAGVVSKALPVPAGTVPVELTHAALAASGDGKWIFGIVDGGGSAFYMVTYQVSSGVLAVPTWTFAPPLGPMVVSPSYDGSYVLSGWALFSRAGIMMAEAHAASGNQIYGSHAFDSGHNLIYSQFPGSSAPAAPASPTRTSPARMKVTSAVPAEEPLLLVMDSDNLLIREKLRVPEFFTGRSVLSADGSMMYAVSESGVTLLPVGSLGRSPRVAALQEDLLFKANFCDRKQMVQEIDVTNPGGGNTPFTVSSTLAGVAVSPQSGVTPAKISVAIDPGVFQNLRGTQVGSIVIDSQPAVNVIPPVRILINNREPDQRGTIFNVPGKLVDVLADPARDRYYVLRQDKDQVLVFDGTSFQQIAALRTGATPVRMSFTFDGKYLLVGNDDSQIANVYDLTTLLPSAPVVFQTGHYPHSIAASAGSLLASCRVAGPKHTISRIDMGRRTAVDFASLGIFENSVEPTTVLSASPSGGSILVAQPGGAALLYDAASDSFPISRSGLTGTNGAYAAISDSRFVIGGTLYDMALHPQRALDSDAATVTSGFAPLDSAGIRTTAAGIVQRVDFSQNAAILPTRMAEAPLAGDVDSPFIRTLAPLANRQGIVSLTTSGVTVLSWQYDAAVVVPQLTGVTNAADGTSSIAPGSLISVWGQNLTAVTLASVEAPLPTTIGDSCLTVNGLPVPLSFVSPGQINGQAPFNLNGSASMVLRTPGGVSNTLNFNVQATAPGVFQAQLPGMDQPVPTIVRAANSTLLTLSNPVHPDDWLTIYLTGMGMTSPAVETGAAAPGAPLAWAEVQPQVMLGTTPLDIGFAGLAPGFAGLYQINAHVPSGGVPTGMEVPLTISQGSSATTFKVRVVR